MRKIAASLVLMLCINGYKTSRSTLAHELNSNSIFKFKQHTIHDPRELEKKLTTQWCRKDYHWFNK